MSTATLLLFLLCANINITIEKCVNDQAREDSVHKTPKLPGLDVCGIPKSDGGDMDIIGGKPSALGVWPWIVRIGNNQLEWNCDGSLISDQYVVTAAHCLFGNHKSVVRVGDLDLNDTVKDGATPIDIKVEKAIYHKNYKGPNIGDFRYDIGLIKLSIRVNFTELIRPLCLPTPAIRHKHYGGKLLTTIGWGMSDLAHGTSPSHLQEVEVTALHQSDCKQQVAKVNPQFVIDDTVICTEENAKGVCYGDSGGPLMTKEGKNWFMLGIVSYVTADNECVLPGYPQVYTRASEYVDWITENMNKLQNMDY